MFSIIETGGKQYIVKPGDKIQVEKLEGAVGDSVTFDKVLMTGDKNDYKLGAPYVASATVSGKVIKQGRGRKIEVLKYKAKSKYRRKIGHRQAYTEIEIV